MEPSAIVHDSNPSKLSAHESSRIPIEQPQDHAAQLELLNRVGLALAGTLEFRAICRTVHQGINALVDAPLFAVLTFDRAAFRTRTLYEVTGDVEANTRIFPPAPLTAEPSRQVLLSPELAPGRWVADGSAPQSCLYVPLLAGDAVVGALLLGSYQPAAYGAPTLPLLIALGNHAAAAIQNARLFEETTRRAREFQVLYQVNQAISSAQTLDETLAMIYAQVSQLMEANNFFVALWDRHSNLMRFPYFVDEKDTLEPGYLRTGRKGLTEYVIESRMSLLTRSREEITRLSEREGIEQFGDDPQSLLAVPMWHNGVVIGAIVLQSYNRPNAYAPDDERLLQVIASQAAIAIDKARLLQDAQRRADEEAFLRDLATASSTALDGAELAAHVTSTLRARFQPRACGFMFLDEAAQVLRLDAAFWGIAPEVSARTIPLGSGIYGQAAQSGRPVLVRDTRDAPQFVDVTGAGARAAACVPVAVDGRSIGVVAVEHARPYAVDENDVRLLAAVARQVGAVIERTRWFDETRRRADQLAAYNAVASTINEWLEVDQAAKRMLGVFLQSTGTRMGGLYLFTRHGKIKLAADFGLPPEQVTSLRELDLTRFPGFLRALEGGRIVVLDDLAAAAVSADGRELCRRLQLGAAALIPLRVKSRSIGVAALASHERGLRVPDLEFLQTLADQAAQAIENARLFAESQRRLEEQSALRELAQQLLSATSPDEVLARTLDTLNALFPADLTEILLPDADADTFRLVAGHGWHAGAIGHAVVAKAPWSYAGYALAMQSPVCVEDFGTETRFQPGEHLRQQQVASGLCAPMLADTRVIGLLGVYSRAPQHLAPEQSYLLYLIATQTAIALEKARHSQAAQRRLEELVLLNDVIHAATSALSLDQVLLTITDQISQLMRSSRAHIYFLNEATGALTARAWQGGGTSPSGAGVTAWVAQTGQPLLVPDARVEPRYRSGAAQTRSELCVPMKIDERVVGVIDVEHPEPNAFDGDDLRLLSALGGQVASIIERARLLDETQKRLLELSTLFEMTNLLRTATTEQEMLALIMRRAVEVLGAAAGSLQLLAEEGASFYIAAVCNMNNLGAQFSREEGNWEAITAGESYTVQDLQTDPHVGLRAHVQGLHGGIVAPLRTPSGVLGTLFVGYQEKGHPPQSQLHLATTIANLAAHALQRLRLHEETVKQAQHLAAALRDLEASYQATLRALSAALDARDHETEGHSQRVTELALCIARGLNLAPEALTALERGALLHDVGKIGVSDNILLKPGPLTAEERALMDGHPRLGYEMLRGIGFLQDALPVVLHHQEKYDGSGYPGALRGDEIPLMARIFAVADAYDAMTSDRPYRRALLHAQAVAEIVRGAGAQFDPQVVAAFLQVFANADSSLPAN